MVNVGLIGCGFMGRTHGNCYKAIKNCKVIGVVDPREKEARWGAEITGGFSGSLKTNLTQYTETPSSGK